MIWVRQLPKTFPDCIRRNPEPAIDLALALQQHAGYRSALKRCCAAPVASIPADDHYPDSVFVEDTALIIGNRAAISRPGAPSRRGEVDAIEQLLRAAGLEIISSADPQISFDGGDCLVTDRGVLVGLSSRTNAAAAKFLAECFPAQEVRPVSVPSDELHLKGVASYLGQNRLLLREDLSDWSEVSEFDRLVVPLSEAYAANCRLFGNRVLISAGYPETRRILESAGFEISAVEMSEFRKADGAISCLSLVPYLQGNRDWF